MTKPKQDSAAIWRELETKTRDLSAWVVLRNGEVVAKLITHCGGRNSPNGLTMRGYVHVLGLPVVRGIARGGGYDMRTAALAGACGNLPRTLAGLDHLDATQAKALADFRALKDQGYDIPHQLRELGYTVEQAL